MELRGAQEWGGRKGAGLQAAAALAGVEGASSPPAQQPLLQGVQDRSWGPPHCLWRHRLKFCPSALGGQLRGARVSECPVCPGLEEACEEVGGTLGFLLA